MAKNSVAVENPAVAAAPRSRFARRFVLGGALLALLSFAACSVLPAEHQSNFTPAQRLRLVAREPYRLTFQYDAYFKPGTTPAGVALWFGDKEHTVMTVPSPRGSTVVEFTPGGLFWTAQCEPEGVLGNGSRICAGPMLLNDFAFRPGPLVPGADGRIAIGDGARPGQPKVTIYLSIAQFDTGAI